MEKEIYIHIGAPRTGTSYLRNNVFPFIQNVYFENKLDSSKSHDQHLVKIFSTLAHVGDGDELSASFTNKKPMNYPAASSGVSKKHVNAPRGGVLNPSFAIKGIKEKKVLISEEHLIWSIYHMMGNIGSRALLLKNCCPNAKIIMTIRRQPEYFVSLFKYFKRLDSSHLHRQMVRIENMLNLELVFEGIRIYFNSAMPIGAEVNQRYKQFDLTNKYFDRYYRHFIAADFSWLRLFNIYEDLFGKNNILVLPQEMILNDISLSLELLSNFIGEEIKPNSRQILKRENTTNTISSPFRNKELEDIFINYIVQLNLFSNKELDKKITYLSLEKYNYTILTSNKVSRKILLGKRSAKIIILNEKICFSFNYLINSWRRRGFLKTFLLLARKIKKAKLVPKLLYHHFMLLLDKIKGVDFERIESIESLGLNSEDSKQYESTKIFELRKIFRDIFLKEKIVAIDLGSGKGRVLAFLAKQNNVKKVYGIEISRRLFQIARKNIEKLGLKRIKVLNSDVRETPQEILDECNLFYLYNPFPESVVENVIKMIETSLRRNKREIYLIYFNPAHQFIIEKSHMLKKYRKYINTISSVETVVFKSF